LGNIRGVDYSDPAVRYRGERITGLLSKILGFRGRGKPIGVDLAIDVFYALFLPVPMLSDSGDLKERMILEAMLRSPRLADVKKYTIADSIASSVAAASFLYHLLNASQSMEDMWGGSSSNDHEKGGRGLSSSVDEALREAAKTAGSAKEIEAAVNSVAAGSGSYLNLEDALQDVYRLAGSTELRELLEYLRSIKALKPAVSMKRRRKAKYSRGEIEGYELGSDLERVEPSELAIPQILFYAKMAESKLTLYEKKLPEPIGPIYMLLDKSGSMVGTKMLWAKAVTIAMARRALSEGRAFYIRFFDSVPYPMVKLRRRVRGRDVAKMLDYIARIKASGGTDITRAILAAVEDLRSHRVVGLSDIVLVTDGEDRVTVDLVKGELRRAKARLFSVMIHGDNTDLREASDKYLKVTSLSTGDVLKVIEI